jgi:nitroreductase/NAD-dependent dihydropyrimidine dehydrogenase PreA subunit
MIARGIDSRKCIKCGKCVTDCPATLFAQDNPTSIPLFGGAERCIGCGHCVAICPAEAIQFAYDADDRQVPSPQTASYDTILSHMASRRSVRRYRDEPVSREHIEAVLEAIRYSPSASNKRKWSFIVITDKQKIRYLAGRTLQVFRLVRRLLAFKPLLAPFVPRLRNKSTEGAIDRVIRDFDQGGDRILLNAPCLIILHSPSYAHMAGVDAGIAVTQGILAAHALRLGTCWIGFLLEVLHFRAGLRKWLGIPKGEQVWGVFTLGHPAVTYHAVPPRDKLRVRWITG